MFWIVNPLMMNIFNHILNPENSDSNYDIKPMWNCLCVGGMLQCEFVDPDLRLCWCKTGDKFTSCQIFGCPNVECGVFVGGCHATTK